MLSLAAALMRISSVPGPAEMTLGCIPRMQQGAERSNYLPLLVENHVRLKKPQYKTTMS